MPEMKTLQIGETVFDIVDEKAVRIESQDLTEEQKIQARENIGAGSQEELADKVSKSVTVALSAPKTLFGADANGNPRKFNTGAGSTSMAKRIPYYTDSNTLKSGTPKTSDDVATKYYVDSNFISSRPQEAQEPPVYLFGSDTGGLSSFKASGTPEPDAVPYYDSYGVLHSSTELIYDDDQVLTYGMVNGIFLCNYYTWTDEDGNYHISGFGVDDMSFDDISAECYDNFKLCVLHVETDEEYNQVIGMRIDWNEMAIYFGNDEYKMDVDSVVTKLK